MMKVKAGEIVSATLPATGTLADGRAVSGYDRLPVDVLRSEGWRRVVDDGPPAHDTSLQTTRRTVGYDTANDVVRATYEIVPLPPSLTVDRDSIPADGTTVATVTYTHPDESTRPARVDFFINGTAKDVALTGATALLEVASSTPGDTIDVVVGGLSVLVTVEA